MPAYHSKFNECVELQVGNMAVLPIKTNFKGPAPRKDDHAEDIIDEALLYFKPNIFFRQFEIKGSADRTLIYLMLYIIECLKRLQKGQKKTEAIKDLTTMALSSKLPIPGEVSFPFQGLFKPPANGQEEETMRAYLQQLRQELGARLCERVFLIPDAPASKWWLCFARRRFMDKALSQTM
ncbi:ARP2/3 complex ARPC3 (21 kDa) subunit domain-containing protein [Ditylenchus destructor]|uniref:Actin-related protein 2/3 complex subunit 3 n=1 Tax=Ditylenchus destructor TaxID=166010 RepID=A0AAD4RE43_9BILA|nr:ARP2/3 complex ARPC3 (21 kDa) subunit domain-containing protein [Ditylenchus destructor]